MAFDLTFPTSTPDHPAFRLALDRDQALGTFVLHSVPGEWEVFAVSQSIPTVRNGLSASFADARR